MLVFSLEREQEWNAKRHVEKILGQLGDGDFTVACWEPGQISPYHCHPEAVEILKKRLAKTGGELNEARLRMARLPKGAEIVENKVSGAPGFMMDNVVVMAGVPSIMQVMLDAAAPKLRTGARMLSDSVRADLREGDIGSELAEVARAHPAVLVGSYPFFDERTGPNTNVVVRARDPQTLAAAMRAVNEMLARVKAAMAS